MNNRANTIKLIISIVGIILFFVGAYIESNLLMIVSVVTSVWLLGDLWIDHILLMGRQDEENDRDE